FGLVPILLDAGRPEAGQAIRVDRDLPAQEFVDRQRVARTGVFKRQEAAANRGDHLRLAANDPAARAGRRQIGDCQGTAVRTDHVFYSRPQRFTHWTLTQTHVTQLAVTIGEAV